LPGAFAAGFPSILHSFVSSALTATVLCASGLCFAGALGGRIRGPGATWLGFLVPGVVLSIAWIHLFNRPGLQAIAAGPLILVFALGVRYLAPAWAGIAAAMRASDPDLVHAARLNAGPGGAFRTGLWPQIRGPVCSVWSVTYLLCLWEVESLLLIVPPGGETLAMRIFNLLHYGHAGQVNALCVLLLALAVGPTAVLSWIGRSREVRVPLHPEP
jgi:ABC-type Fe3+ transport system permease subunit